MPELPEVETICDNLRELIQGRRIIEVDIFEQRLRNPVGDNFALILQGRTVLDVVRKGKYILVSLEGGMAWISHLGMSGKLICVGRERPRERHDHIIVKFDNGKEVRYHDPRRFGLSVVMPAAAIERWPQIRRLGMDPLDHQFNSGYLFTVARTSRRRIINLLMDQKVVAGLGNIYANEILFRAGVRPTRRGWRIGRKMAVQITHVTPKLLREAIHWRGTSFSDYRDGEDRKGEFQNHLRVYNRGGQSCAVCACEIKKVPIGNRSAFYCPTCQR
jgi:formamidopyrimidine-DNA glycosylase